MRSACRPDGTFRSLKSEAVGFLGSDLAAAYLTKQGAQPVPLKTLAFAKGPVAAPTWQLRGFGFTITDFRLFRREHVMAVPPGENGWLKRLGDFLQQHKSEVPDRIEAAEIQP